MPRIQGIAGFPFQGQLVDRSRIDPQARIRKMFSAFFADWRYFFLCLMDLFVFQKKLCSCEDGRNQCLSLRNALSVNNFLLEALEKKRKKFITTSCQGTGKFKKSNAE